MKVIDRERPLKRLIGMMHNGRIKIITGIRRSGKSFCCFDFQRTPSSAGYR